MILDNTIIVFRCYLLGIFVFLMFICFFLSKYLSELFYLNFFLYYRLHPSSPQFSDINKLQSLISINLKKKKWLDVILIIELCGEKNILSDEYVCEALGFCYEKLLYLVIAKYYYLRILKRNNIYIIYSLIKQYKKINNLKEFKNLCNIVKKIDPNNSFIETYHRLDLIK